MKLDDWMPQTCPYVEGVAFSEALFLFFDGGLKYFYGMFNPICGNNAL